MRKLLLILVLSLSIFGADKAITDKLFGEFLQEGGKNFSIDAGDKIWHTVTIVDGKEISCVSCHTKDLKSIGKHIKSGKVIEPMSPSVNKNRFTDIKEVKKWFKRNCKDVFNRECSAQEKGDLLTYILAQ